MGIPGSANPLLFGGEAQAYEIEQSLRFNSADSAYLNRTPGSTGDRQTWTYSFWWKHSNLSTEQYLISADTSTGQETWLRYNADGTIRFQTFGGSNANLASTAVFRDPSAWYHFVLVFDSTQATASNRVLIYVNGVQQTLSGTNPSLNENQAINNTVTHQIMRRASSSGNYGNGYLAEVNFIDGSALDHEDFGELDDNGVWRPIEYAGSYTGNSFYLKFASGDGTDSSGLSNTWTANNFTTSGTGTDVMSDTPTTNYATLNPLAYRYGEGNATFSEGNLKAYFASSATESYQQATIGASSGKFYWEYELTAWTGDRQSGPLITKQSWLSTSSGSVIYWYKTTGAKFIQGTESSYGASFGVGDVIGVAMDFDGGNLEFFKNGTSQGVAATDLDTFFTVSEPAFPSGRANFGTTYVVNFGQRAFEYTPPTGYKALNTSNLPAPDIKNGSDYFDTKLFTAGTTTVTGLSFQPDWVWVKNRDQTYNHRAIDAVRGVKNDLYPNNNSAEQTNQSDSLLTFTSDGFTHGKFGSADADDFVAWNWLAGNGTSSNTAGDITSTVSVSATSGFSIVSYTGENAVRTVGHGLGVAPVMYMTKRLDNAGDWSMYWEVLGATRLQHFNLISKNETDSAYWNDTAPTSTVFTVGTNTRTGGSTDDYIAYCFADVEGYSRFYEYRGTGNSDGPYVPCGFRPAVLVIKNYAGGSETNWVIKDTARDTYNPSTKRLNPNQNYVESDDSNVNIDFLSNGFKVRSTNTSVNENGSDYLFMAFAENPFGGSGVSPATAR